MTEEQALEDLRARFKADMLMDLTTENAFGVLASGGGDSTALLYLIAELGLPYDIYVLGIDHRLRKDAEKELRALEAHVNHLGFIYDQRSWEEPDQRGNLLQNARLARQVIAREWAEEKGFSTILTGHTRTDQAETLLMRLARGSGVDGLASMRRVARMDGITWVKPLLGISRAALRVYLKANEISYADDPTNEDLTFDRIKFRKALPELSQLGLDEATLARTAHILSRSSDALAQTTQEFSKNVAKATPFGSVRIDLLKFREGHEEFQLRLLVECLRWIAGSGYPPRLNSTSRARDAILSGENFTLGGVMFDVSTKDFHAAREVSAVTPIEASPHFDGRWKVDATKKHRPIGADLDEIMPNWRCFGYPRLVWQSLPCYDDREAQEKPPHLSLALDEAGPLGRSLLRPMHHFAEYKAFG